MEDKQGHKLTNEEFTKKVMNRIMTILREFQIFLLHIVGFVPSHIVRRACYRLSGISIGAGSTIHMGARFYRTDNISIGRDTIIGECVVLDGRDKIKIGDHVDFATGVMVYNSQHDLESHDFHAVSKKSYD